MLSESVDHSAIDRGRAARARVISADSAEFGRPNMVAGQVQRMNEAAVGSIAESENFAIDRCDA